MASKYDYVFHCTVPKAASVWFSSLFAHEWVCASSGLRRVDFGYWLLEKTGTNAWQRIDGPPLDIAGEFPSRTLLSPVYCTPAYLSTLTKTVPNWAAVFVMRDPRDLIVSHYYSLRHSHPAVGSLDDFVSLRERLRSASLTDGMIDVMRQNVQVPYHGTMPEWQSLANRDSRVALVKFEDIFGSDQRGAVRRMFEHCDIRMDDTQLRQLLSAYRFEDFAGRPAGVEDVAAHWRKGIAGDWKRHFDDRLRNAYVEMFGDLPERLGYEPTL